MSNFFFCSSNRYRRHSHSRSRSEKREPIDKKKLLEIARKNAISMLKNGALPKNISETTKEKLMAKIRHGGKSIEELTNYCKKLSKAEDLGELSELSDSDNDAEGRAKVFHHPFEVRDRGPIVMNIRVSSLHFSSTIPSE
jgi:protein SON